jgi:hypothetical protein
MTADSPAPVPEAAPQWLVGRWAPLWLLLAICAVRAVSVLVGIVNVDESDFFLIARVMARGGVVFRDVVEGVPPLIYVAYLPSALTRMSLFPVRVVGVLGLWATCLVLRRATETWTGSARAGWLAAWACFLATLCEGPSVSSELVMNLPSALALHALVRARKQGGLGRVLAAGAWVGVASLVKHQAGMLLAPLAVGVLWPEPPAPPPFDRASRRLGATVLLGVGFAVPWALAVGAWWLQGALPEFLEWVVVRDLAYAALKADPPWGRLAQSLILCLLGATLLLWALAVREAFRRPWDAIRAMLVAALMLTLIPVSLGGRFYEHYFLQFAPPLAMLAGVGAEALFERWATLARWKRGAVMALLVLPVSGNVGYTVWRALAGGYPGQEAKTVAVAEWLRANAAPGDTLFVWGHVTPLYVLSGLDPGTRYINTSTHMGNFDPAHLPDDFDPRHFRNDADVRGTLEDLEQHRPRWLVDTAPADIHHWSRIPLAAFPELRSYVDGHYAPVATPAGAVVYRRRETP